jgi:digeranylgeranylglycerophospholipid reductase
MVKTTVKDLIRKEGKVCGVVAKHLGKTMQIRADLVIAADGLESNVAKMAGINTFQNPNNVGSCAQYEMVGLEVQPQYIEFYLGDKIAPRGYLWVFPKSENTANVGVGIRSSTQTAYHYLKKFTSKLDATPIELNVGGVPISGTFAKTFTDGLLVVGDAAGQVDAVTGAGIHITAACSRIAGEVAAEAVKNEDTSSKFLEKYETLWKASVGGELKNSLKRRKMIDKLTDDDINALVKFFKGKDIESIPKLSLLKLVKERPRLLKLLKELI